jgi:CRISPR-associated protein Cas6
MRAGDFAGLGRLRCDWYARCRVLPQERVRLLKGRMNLEKTMLGDSAPLNSVDLIFPALGSTIPREHGYALYGAISRIVPWLHGEEAKAQRVGLFPIRGTRDGDRSILLTDRSAVRIRVPASQLPAFLPLAGKVLELDGCRLRLGVPRVCALMPAPVLSSSLVLIKIAHAEGNGCITPDLFLASARRKLAEISISAEPGLQLIREGPRAGQARRRVIRVKEQTHAGYAIIVQGLTAEESIRLQEHGMGGRRVMGCGLFLPEREEVIRGLNI